MTLRSAPALVAVCTAMFGLHSSSSTSSSYSYFALGSALRSFTASSAELRPPIPFAATPPVSGPMKTTFTLSLASTPVAGSPTASAVANSATLRFPCNGIFALPEIGPFCPILKHDPEKWVPVSRLREARFGTCAGEVRIPHAAGKCARDGRKRRLVSSAPEQVGAAQAQRLHQQERFDVGH